MSPQRRRRLRVHHRERKRERIASVHENSRGRSVFLETNGKIELTRLARRRRNYCHSNIKPQRTRIVSPRGIGLNNLPRKSGKRRRDRMEGTRFRRRYKYGNEIPPRGIISVYFEGGGGISATERRSSRRVSQPLSFGYSYRRAGHSRGQRVRFASVLNFRDRLLSRWSSNIDSTEFSSVNSGTVLRGQRWTIGRKVEEIAWSVLKESRERIEGEIFYRLFRETSYPWFERIINLWIVGKTRSNVLERKRTDADRAPTRKRRTRNR